MCGGPEIILAEIFMEEVATEIIIDAIVESAVETVVADVVVGEVVTDVIVSEVAAAATDMSLSVMDGVLASGDIVTAAVESGIDPTLVVDMSETITTGLAEEGISESAIQTLVPEESLVEVTGEGAIDSTQSYLEQANSAPIETTTEVGSEVAPGSGSSGTRGLGAPTETGTMADPTAYSVEDLTQVGSNSQKMVTSESLMSQGGVMSDSGTITMPNGATYDMVSTPFGDAWQLSSGTAAGAGAADAGLNWATIKGVLTSPAAMVAGGVMAKNYMEDQQKKALEQAMAARQSRSAGTTTINTSTSSGTNSTSDLAALPVLNANTGDTVSVAGTDSGTDYGLGQIGGNYDPNVRLGRRIASTTGYTNQYFDQRPFGSSINSGTSNNTQASGWGSQMFTY